MDEQTVRGWLKEQQDRVETLAQQQAATFQLQFDALRVELQASLGLIQGRHDEGGDQGTLFCREGAAAEWFRWMTRNGLITDWARFVESVKSRFGPSKYEDPQGALSKLLQLGLNFTYKGNS
ncbi:hypothetical protein Tco_0917259 [Tanacetum coccineum]